ncbi:hypothetical protein ACJZ2D_015782 [Fusarium nematophilum]
MGPDQITGRPELLWSLTGLGPFTRRPRHNLQSGLSNLQHSRGSPPTHLEALRAAERSRLNFKSEANCTNALPLFFSRQSRTSLQYEDVPVITRLGISYEAASSCLQFLLSIIHSNVATFVTHSALNRPPRGTHLGTQQQPLADPLKARANGFLTRSSEKMPLISEQQQPYNGLLTVLRSSRTIPRCRRRGDSTNLLQTSPRANVTKMFFRGFRRYG